MSSITAISNLILTDCLECISSIREKSAELQDLDCVTLKIGECAIRLVFYSEPLRTAILPAFQHLLSEDLPVFTVYIHNFDSAPEASNLARLLDPPEDRNALRLLDGPNLTCFTQDKGKVVSAIDWAHDEAYWMIRCSDDLSYLERSSPLRPLLTHWLARRGQFLVHAAAVGNSHGGVLILGQGGSGKSTTSLVCLEAGLEYVADDHCLVEGGSNPVVNSLFSTGKLAERQLPQFPLLYASAMTHGRCYDEKVVLYLSRLAALPLKRKLSLRAILVAQITGKYETELRPLSSGKAFKAISSSCALHFQSTRQDALRCFGGLVRDLPAYVLELGTNSKSIPKIMRELLNNLEGKGS
jgi:hypothetical protein